MSATTWFAAVVVSSFPLFAGAENAVDPGAPSSSQTGETQPKSLKTPPPTYPEALRRANIEGKVIAWIYVDASGRVNAVSIRESPHKLFSQATIAAISQWEYRAPTKDGKPKPFISEYVLDFKLRN